MLTMEIWGKGRFTFGIDVPPLNPHSWSDRQPRSDDAGRFRFPWLSSWVLWLFADTPSHHGDAGTWQLVWSGGKVGWPSSLVSCWRGGGSWKMPLAPHRSLESCYCLGNKAHVLHLLNNTHGVTYRACVNPAGKDSELLKTNFFKL